MPIQRRRTVLASAVGVLLAFGCTSVPDRPCPKDDELLALFEAHKEDFTKLLADPGSQERRRQLGVLDVHPDHAGGTYFWSWSLDFAGPGGVLKGFFHSETEPRGLVASIDDNSEPGSPEDKALFRHIEGPWYLFYRSNN